MSLPLTVVIEIGLAIGIYFFVVMVLNSKGDFMTATQTEQAHEKFKTFRGTMQELHEGFAAFAAEPNIQIKSISALARLLSVGYIEGEKSPVYLEDRIVDQNDLDISLAEIAQQASGDVICHSIYLRDSGTMACLLLVHRD